MASHRPTPEQEQEYYLSAYLDFAGVSFENVVESTLNHSIANIIKRKNERAKGIVSEDYYVKMMNDYYETLFEIEDKEIIFALNELKIMYLYKHFEIKLKELARESFEDWPKDREVFKWDDIINFYKSKEINLKEFNNYESVYDLSRVNNSLKHSGKNIGKKIKNIPEFRKAEILESKYLKAFYLRVKGAPKELIRELASVINNRLFPRVKSDFELEIDESTIEFDDELPSDW